MSLQLFMFYVFAIVCVAAAGMVISQKNPVHSVLFLILAFFNGAGLFVLIGAEFLAMVLVVVYVGAVAVLFMFVVMMLNINYVQMREGFLQYLPVGALIGLILLVELFMVTAGYALTGPETEAVADATGSAALAGITNTEAMGNVLYTEYFYLFQAAAVILLVAIIGAISLTLRSRPGVLRQSISDQVARRPQATIELKKVKPGAGI